MSYISLLGTLQRQRKLDFSHMTILKNPSVNEGGNTVLCAGADYNNRKHVNLIYFELIQHELREFF